MIFLITVTVYLAHAWQALNFPVFVLFFISAPLLFIIACCYIGIQSSALSYTQRTFQIGSVVPEISAFKQINSSDLYISID